jgi:hypothetical protein
MSYITCHAAHVSPSHWIIYIQPSHSLAQTADIPVRPTSITTLAEVGPEVRKIDDAEDFGYDDDDDDDGDDDGDDDDDDDIGGSGYGDEIFE